MRKREIAIEDLLRLKFVADPQMSPDGSRVAFTVKTVDAEKNRYLSHLWTVEVATGAARQFTCGEVSDGSPRWSPDGKRIAFLRTEDKDTQIWMIPTDGGEARQLTQLGEGGIGAPEWSPDGKQMAFTFRPTHPDWTQEARQERQAKGQSDPPRIIPASATEARAKVFSTCASTFGSAMPPPVKRSKSRTGTMTTAAPYGRRMVSESRLWPTVVMTQTRNLTR